MCRGDLVGPMAAQEEALFEQVRPEFGKFPGVLRVVTLQPAFPKRRQQNGLAVNRSKVTFDFATICAKRRGNHVKLILMVE